MTSGPGMRPLAFALLLLGLATPCAAARAASLFDAAEVSVAPSPLGEARCALAQGSVVVDLEAAPTGGEAAVLVKDAGGFWVGLWTLGAEPPALAWRAPAGLTMRSVTWHPEKRTLLLLGSEGAEHRILKLSNAQGRWEPTIVKRSAKPLRRLVAAPRPFLAYDAKGKPVLATRLFFGEEQPGKSYTVRSVTEDGKREYQTIGPKASFTAIEGEDPPSEIAAATALPLGFHPSGQYLLWEDGRHAFQVARYTSSWSTSQPLAGGGLSGGTVTFLPNGLGVLHWRPGEPGVAFVLDRGATRLKAAPGVTFASTPTVCPDGRGLAGVVKGANGDHTLTYLPVEMPLGDVANAWLFAPGPRDRDLLGEHGGLFRAEGGAQLYELYERESYPLDEPYGPITPYRPLLVTTDLFWELFSAAYQGLFLVRERQQAIPQFWAFVDAARASLATGAPASRWGKVFSAVAAVRTGGPGPEGEADRIRALKPGVASPVLGRPFDYGELKPRGHYTSSRELSAYFVALRYLTEVARTALDARELKSLPPEVRGKALSWIGAYEPFISKARSELVFRDGPFAPPPYARHPGEKAVLFPLSWGFDNEVLLTTVYHDDWREPERIQGPAGRRRLLPSGLDLAAALGSRFALTLLGEELAEYPPLWTALSGLQQRWAECAKDLGVGASLYDRWLTALAVQWADDAVARAPVSGRELWTAKRLQTGLASWATLRHATVLVNERTSAEAGEGGFEQLVARPARGFVEPDPLAFEALASLFDEARALVDRGGVGLPPGATLADPDGLAAAEPVTKALVRRLGETASKARGFAAIARKEQKGEPLTPAEYEEIARAGRLAEHHLLLFSSLASRDLALSNPDPMAKVVDVAGGPDAGGYLLAGVGEPLRWDLLVPHFGRRQIVMGSVYAYHELASPALLDDAAWRQGLATVARPAWVGRYVAAPAVGAGVGREPF